MRDSQTHKERVTYKRKLGGYVKKSEIGEEMKQNGEYKEPEYFL